MPEPLFAFSASSQVTSGLFVRASLKSQMPGFRQWLRRRCAPILFQSSLHLHFTSSARQPLTEANSKEFSHR
jgi:hypothetical protein